MDKSEDRALLPPTSDRSIRPPSPDATSVNRPSFGSVADGHIDLTDGPREGSSQLDESQPKERLEGPPQLFLSYRTDDTGSEGLDLIDTLSANLKADFGRNCVFRDKEDLILGQRWQDGLSNALDEADGIVYLIGPSWTGEREDGTLRIEDRLDPVRAEVVHSLEFENKATPLPVLVDVKVEQLKAQLDEELCQLFDRTHVVQTRSERIFDPDSLDYQRILVGAWCSLTDHIEDAVLIIGEIAEAELHKLIEAVLGGSTATAQELTRISAQAHVFKPGQVRRKMGEWTDVFVITDSDERSDRERSLIQALNEHPRIKNISIISGAFLAGSAGGAALAGHLSSSGGSSVGGASSTAGTSAAGSAAGGPTGISGLLGGGIAVKVGVGVTAAIAAGAAATTLFDDEGFSFSGSTSAAAVQTDERAFPFGAPADARVIMGDEMGVEGSETDVVTGLVRRSLVVELPGEEPIEMGEIEYPAGFTGTGAEINSDGTFNIGSVTVTADLTYTELDPGDFCFDTSDPNRVVGGWQFTGQPADVTAALSVVMENGKVVDSNTAVFVDGPAQLTLIEELEPDFDLSRCSATSASIQWQN